MMIDKQVSRLLRAFAAESVDEAGGPRLQPAPVATDRPGGEGRGPDAAVPEGAPGLTAEATAKNTPITAAELAAHCGKSLAKEMKALAPPQMAFLSQSLAATALRIDAPAAVELVCAQGGDDLRLALKKVEPKVRRQLARELATAAMRLEPGGVIDAVTAASTPAKLVIKGQEEALSRLAAWFVHEPRLAQKLLGEGAGAVILEKKSDYHYVPNYFGGAHKKLSPLPTVPMFGPLATEAIGSGACSLNYDRLYTLYNVLQRLGQAGNGPFGVVEVGVYKGGTSCFLARLMEALGLEGCSLHACDTFIGHVQEDLVAGFDRYSAGHFVDTSEESVRARLAPFPFARMHVGRVQDTAHELPQRIGLVHLDTDLYEPTRFGLGYFFDRLVPNGAIVVDDFGAKSCPGVAQAVAEFAAERRDAFVLPMLTAQCLVMRSGVGV